jgi:hypothetical protein
VGGISLSDSDDLSVGCVGRPLPDVRIKLQNWEEGGYTVNDEQGRSLFKVCCGFCVTPCCTTPRYTQLGSVLIWLSGIARHGATLKPLSV